MAYNLNKEYINMLGNVDSLHVHGTPQEVSIKIKAALDRGQAIPLELFLEYNNKVLGINDI